MQRILLTLLTIVAFSPMAVLKAGEPEDTTPTQAARMGDAEMKALIVGTWNVDQGRTFTFTSDGRWIDTDPKFPNASEEERTERWDVKDGQLIEIRGSVESDRSYTILFLTKHEFLAQWDDHSRGYIFLNR
jgi:hypothetical protein